MIVGIYTDCHFSISSSILNNISGYRYSARLDYLIESFKWMYDQFEKNKVDIIFNLGDLMDSNLLKAREASALSEALSYSKGIPEYYLVGNHEIDDKGSKFSTSSIINKNRSITVIDSPTKIDDTFSAIPFTTYYESIDFNSLQNKILLSHNNYIGMNIGEVQLSTGFDMGIVSEYFDIVLNGHIHTPGSYENNKIINVGALIGIGFGDNYDLSTPCIMILNTDTMEYHRIPNPYSVLFYKRSVKSISELSKFFDSIKSYKNPKCIKIEVPYSIRDNIRDYIDKSKDQYNIIADRIQTHIENSKILLDDREDVEVLQGFDSGSSAMIQYVNNQSDDSLPATKKQMIDFVERYLR